jgi:hypothetical protein
MLDAEIINSILYSSSTASSGTIRTTTAAEIPNWYMKADYVETCNCDYGCPCNFTGFPTYGYCRALVFFHIRQSNFGENVKLDGLQVIYAASWPKAIHEGNGTMQLFNYSSLTKQMNSKDKL